MLGQPTADEVLRNLSPEGREHAKRCVAWYMDYFGACTDVRFYQHYGACGPGEGEIVLGLLAFLYWLKQPRVAA